MLCHSNRKEIWFSCDRVHSHAITLVTNICYLMAPYSSVDFIRASSAILLLPPHRSIFVPYSPLSLTWQHVFFLGLYVDGFISHRHRRSRTEKLLDQIGSNGKARDSYLGDTNFESQVKNTSVGSSWFCSKSTR